MICLNFSDKFILSYQRQNPGKIRTSGTKITSLEKLEAKDWLNALYASLSVYIASGKLPDEQLLQMKLNECLYILNTQYNLNLFSLITEKVKIQISLREFIDNNFMFNAPMQRFAELSGRSLSSFKRECLKIWGESPAKVIMEKRLNKAHQLLHEGKRPSEIFFDLGFETLAHFSRCFKNRFGVPPVQVGKRKKRIQNIRNNERKERVKGQPVLHNPGEYIKKYLKKKSEESDFFFIIEPTTKFLSP